MLPDLWCILEAPEPSLPLAEVSVIAVFAFWDTSMVGPDDLASSVLEDREAQA